MLFLETVRKKENNNTKESLIWLRISTWRTLPSKVSIIYITALIKKIKQDWVLLEVELSGESITTTFVSKKSAFLILSYI